MNTNRKHNRTQLQTRTAFQGIRRSAMLCLLAGVALVGTANGASGDEKRKLVVDGSSTVGPIAKAFAGYLMRKDKSRNITVNESGSGNGAKAMIEGKCDVATLSRFMKDSEFQAAYKADRKPTAHAIALDGIAITVNAANPVKNLKIDQIRDIYAGTITNWKQLGGPDLPIVVISRDSSSGTYETFMKLVMKKTKVTNKAEYVGSSGQMRARLQNTKGAIGYLGLGFVDKTVKAVRVNSIPATIRAIKSGAYPLARNLYLFTNGYPARGTLAHKFVTLYLSREGQQIISRLGFVPVTDYPEEE